MIFLFPSIVMLQNAVFFRPDRWLTVCVRAITVTLQEIRTEGKNMQKNSLEGSQEGSREVGAQLHFLSSLDEM